VAPEHDTVVPSYIADWFQQLQARTLAELVADPTRAAVFSVDMTVGFCKQGALASERVGALAKPIADLFQRARSHGIRHFVLLQDTHSPDAPEFGAFPPHCVRGTEEARTIPELAGLPFARDFTIIEKNSLHPAINTDFDPWLDGHQELQAALVVGNCTDLCVYQTAMHLRLRANALDRPGIRVIVPSDGVDTYELPEDVARASGIMAHPGGFFHQVFLYHLALNGVQVVRTIL